MKRDGQVQLAQHRAERWRGWHAAARTVAGEGSGKRAVTLLDGHALQQHLKTPPKKCTYDWLCGVSRLAMGTDNTQSYRGPVDSSILLESLRPSQSSRVDSINLGTAWMKYGVLPYFK